MSSTGERVDPVVAQGVRIAYGSKVVIEELSLRVTEGSVYALLGRNGAGKSSFVRCLLGQRRAETGRLEIVGRDPWKERHLAMAEVGVAPEEPNIPLAMTPASLGRFCSRLYRRWDEPFFVERLQRFGIGAKTAFGNLSRGQKAQLSLVAAMASRPSLLVLDDPTLGLDAVARREIYDELIGDLADRGVTVLLASHDLEGVEAVATHVGFLKSGRLIVDEPLEELKSRFRRLSATKEKASALREYELIERRELPWGVEAITERFPAEGRVGPEESLEDGIEASELRLEEIFVLLARERTRSSAVDDSADLREAV